MKGKVLKTTWVDSVKDKHVFHAKIETNQALACGDTVSILQSHSNEHRLTYLLKSFNEKVKANEQFLDSSWGPLLEQSEKFINQIEGDY